MLSSMSSREDGSECDDNVTILPALKNEKGTSPFPSGADN